MNLKKSGKYMTFLHPPKEKSGSEPLGLRSAHTVRDEGYFPAFALAIMVFREAST